MLSLSISPPTAYQPQIVLQLETAASTKLIARYIQRNTEEISGVGFGGDCCPGGMFTLDVTELEFRDSTKAGE